MSMLEIEKLTKRFGDKVVLSGLDLQVPAGSIYGFIGKNGAGKTTTMKLITGLMPADGGCIRVAGERVVYGRAAGSQRHIGYLPDVPEFYGFMTAEEYLRFCGDIAGLDRALLRMRVAQLLELVGLSGDKHRIGGFSRGMKQRLGIAQALLGRPKLLICDEPTSALDPVGRKDILNIIKNASVETTVLFSTHILSDVERICTNIGILKDGKIVRDGAVHAIREAGHGERYELFCASTEGRRLLLQRFPQMQAVGETGGYFRARCHAPEQVLAFIAGQGIRLIRFEQKEKTLEELFMEELGQ